MSLSRIREVQTRELAMMLARRFVVGAGGFFRGVEKSEIKRAVFNLDPRPPAATRPVEPDPFVAVRSARLLVSQILGSRRQPKIGDPIIAALSVPVIEIAGR